jgi:hypothetical protein
MAQYPIEQHKYRCGVRQLLIWRKEWGLIKFREYCNSQAFYKNWHNYKDDFITQWKLGNRGEKDNWL